MKKTKTLFCRCCLSFLVGLTVSSIGYSQEKIEITGVVTDTARNPLQGVSIVLKSNPTGGSSTNESGRFIFEAAKGETLVFSNIGFLRKEIVIHDERRLNVVLENDTSLMDEVVVVAYGTQ